MYIITYTAYLHNDFDWRWKQYGPPKQWKYSLHLHTLSPTQRIPIIKNLISLKSQCYGTSFRGTEAPSITWSSRLPTTQRFGGHHWMCKIKIAEPSTKHRTLRRTILKAYNKQISSKEITSQLLTLQILLHTQTNQNVKQKPTLLQWPYAFQHSAVLRRAG